jgi:peptide chain release factor 2
VIVRALRSKKKWVEDYEKAINLADELQIAYDFFKEGDLSEEELDELFDTTNTHIENIEFRNMLSDEGDSMSAVLQITAGAGGTESCDWASMLMRMYLMWGEKNGYKVKELNFQEGDVAGIKIVTLEF